MDETMFELDGFWSRYLHDNSFDESYEDDDFDLEAYLEASAMKAYKNKIKDDVRSNNPEATKKEVKQAAKAASKDIKRDYKIYKLTCQKQGTKPLSLKEYAKLYQDAQHSGDGFTMRDSKQELRKILEAVEEDDFDDSFDEFDDFFEASTNKMLKTFANDRMDENNVIDSKKRKEMMKKFKALAKESYKEYKQECKADGTKPMKKKEFFADLLKQAENQKYAVALRKEDIDEIVSVMESMHENLTTGKGSYPQSSVSIPGGLSETPKAKPYDAASISIPASKEITPAEYQQAINMLAKSYKESAAILEQLGAVDVVNITLENKQEEFAESAIDNAIMEAYDNGPIFESVNRSDKKEIKKIVSELRNKISDKLDDMDIKFHQPRILVRYLRGTIWTTYLWQVIGCCYVENGNISTVVKALNNEFNDSLGEYKILPVKVISTIVDLFKNKFGFKNNKKTFFLLVDKKIPAELKNQNSSNNSENVNESVEDDYDDNSFDESYEDDDFDLEAYLEASAMKAYKNKIKDDVRSNNPEATKKEVKQAAKAASKDIKRDYKIYKLTCQKQGTKPLSLKEYAKLYQDAQHSGDGFTMRDSKQELRNLH